MARLGSGVAFCLAAAVAFFVAVAAEAQPGRGPGGPGGMMGGPGMMGGKASAMVRLLGIADVQKEIELTDDQKAKMKEIGEKAAAQMREQFSGFRDLSQEERQKKFEEMRTKAPERDAELLKKVNEVLLPHQVQRLEELRVQSLGNRAISDPDVQKALGITDQQKAQLDAIRKTIEDTFAKAREGMDNLSQEERRAKFQEMREKFTKVAEEAQTKAQAVLTADQKAKLETLKGKKADYNLNTFGPGGRGPGGRGQGNRGPGGRGPGGAAPGGNA